MNIGWFIREPEGKQFLREIIESNDLALFNIVTVQMHVEFFYLKYKKFLFANELPMFLAKLSFFYLQMFSNEAFEIGDKMGNGMYITI